jgi:hypothetical protein
MFQLYTMRRGGLFYATGLCQLCTSKHCPTPHSALGTEFPVTRALRRDNWERKQFSASLRHPQVTLGYLSGPREWWEL